MLNRIKIVISWILRKETMGNLIFATRVIETLCPSKGSKGASIAKAMRKRLEIAQKALDDNECVSPNRQTEKNVDIINKDKKTFAGFSAKLIKDKHGEGNSGIDLSVKAKVLGQNINLSYDPSDGSARFNLGS